MWAVSDVSRLMVRAMTESEIAAAVADANEALGVFEGLPIATNVAAHVIALADECKRREGIEALEADLRLQLAAAQEEVRRLTLLVVPAVPPEMVRALVGVQSANLGRDLAQMRTEEAIRERDAARAEVEPLRKEVAALQECLDSVRP